MIVADWAASNVSSRAMRTVTFHSQFRPKERIATRPDIPVSSIEDILEIVSILGESKEMGER